MNNFVDEKGSEIKENVLAGIVGAFLFSLAGAVIYFLLNMIGYVASISGLVGAVCAVKGYAIFSKKESKKGIVIATIVSLLVMVFAWYLCVGYDIYDAYKMGFEMGEIDFTITFLDAVRAIPVFLEDAEIAGTCYRNLALGMFFCLLGCASFVINKFRNANQKKVQAPAASVDQTDDEKIEPETVNSETENSKME